ncbi:helix-turn-helix domain-containing protein [Psychrobacter pygoscelis]|uniref:helix-turn-helix domain-containing protein n=1 Tax=Psychrobacter pygoscelis TaxID=2488563 RepID=UPI00103E6CE3|nr:helix-turn-helix transcriptional regulator [Psychrobacter pygoscelis]
MRYAKLGNIINYLKNIMYQVNINNQQYFITDNEHVAWSAYRAACREYDNKSKKVALLNDDRLLHAKAADLMLLDDVDSVTANDLLKIIMQQLNIDIKQVKEIVKESGLPLSNSRVGSWTLPPDNRRYTQMHNDELAAILPYLLSKSIHELGYTPANLKQLRQRLRLTQEQVAKIVGVAGNRQVRRWENGEQPMPHDKWQLLLELDVD